MSKTFRYCLYAVIIGFCIIAIIIGVNAQFFSNNNVDVSPEINIVGTNDVSIQTTDYNNEFMQIFNNTVPKFKDYANLKRIDVNKDFLYVYSENPQLPNGPYLAKKDNNYDIVAYLPLFNIDSDVTKNFNNVTMSYFGKMVNDLILGQKNNSSTTLNISFGANINDDILSVAIIAKIKEIDKPDRIVIQGYNYDFANNKEVMINDVLAKKGIDVQTAQSKIKSVVKNADDRSSTSDNKNFVKQISSRSATQTAVAKPVLVDESKSSNIFNNVDNNQSNVQQNVVNSVGNVTVNNTNVVFKRDLNSDIYTISKVTNFVLGPNGEIYIIYAYGNQTYTSEMDIVKL